MKRSTKERCPVCKTAIVEPGFACADCSMLALRAYGWAQGSSDGVTLTRGPADPGARADLDRLTGREGGPT